MRLSSEAVDALLVETDKWPQWAPEVQPQLERMAAGSGGRFIAQDIDDAIFDGKMHAWLALDAEAEADPAVRAMLVTEIIAYPRLKVLRLVGLVGEDMRTWLPLWPEVEGWARTQQCKRVEALHPPAYSRLLGRIGWSEWHVLSEKIL